MIVAYEAVDQSGKEVAATVDARDVRSAIETLRSQNLVVTRAREHTPGAKVHTSAPSASDVTKVKLHIKQLVMFTRQMAMLMSSGSSVVPALNTVARQFTKPAQLQMVRRIAHDLEEGTSLSEALRKFPRSFDTSYCAIVAAGEATATLAPMFERLSKIVGKRRAMRNKVFGAMAYPTLLTALSSKIILVLLFFVLPRFNEMFDNLGVPLPTSTVMLLAVADFGTRHWLLCIIGGAGLAVGAATLVMSVKGRRVATDVSMSIPVVGKLISGLIQGETFRVMGMLVGARVGLLEAIDLVRGVTPNRKYQQLYDNMESEVVSGGSVSRALEASNLVAPYICQAVFTGEESGKLGESMTYVADVLDEDNTELLQTVTKLLEPAILIIMGIVVGFVSVSLFLPMFDVTSAIK